MASYNIIDKFPIYARMKTIQQTCEIKEINEDIFREVKRELETTLRALQTKQKLPIRLGRIFSESVKKDGIFFSSPLWFIIYDAIRNGCDETVDFLDDFSRRLLGEEPSHK